ncbi:hypothetical protein NRIC_37720 [Enterococcus florum]|uniref:Uncharacterized protein n=1 Tax=Enterococcus florum TaxID=2480627 RepID=A0A4P5PHH9_9ENTE|nr:hypothetical protein NRIC_37720 [Enterococcus florum]
MLKNGIKQFTSPFAECLDNFTHNGSLSSMTYPQYNGTSGQDKKIRSQATA